MALVLQEIIDSDFEYFVKVTTTGTNSAASVFDASDAAGAATDPRTTITGVAWSVGSQTDILLMEVAKLGLVTACHQFLIMVEVE